MKRWRTENINTPEHFDEVWTRAAEHANGDRHFQLDRLTAFIDQLPLGPCRVLDMGCGLFGWAEMFLRCGPNGESIRKNHGITFHGLDFSAVAGQTLTQRCPDLVFHRGDCCATGLPDNMFDMTGAGELIEHMEDPALLVAEMARVTKPGGRVVIGTVDPHCADAHANGCEYPEHLWEFMPRDLIGLCAPLADGQPVYWRVGNYDFVRFIKHGL